MTLYRIEVYRVGYETPELRQYETRHEYENARKQIKHHIRQTNRRAQGRMYGTPVALQAREFKI